jgi:hypothetical protein
MSYRSSTWKWLSSKRRVSIGSQRKCDLRQSGKEASILVVTRRAAEQIEVTVLSVNGSRVRLGTEAPDDTPILREELLERFES